MSFNPFIGKYLFHLHTNATDGQLEPEAVLAIGQMIGAERVIFLEHLRRCPNYDPHVWAHNIRKAGQNSGVEVFAGFEAKFLSSGNIDMTDEQLLIADVVGIAEHGYSGNCTEYERDLRHAMDSTRHRYGDGPIVWVHPGLWLKKQNLIEKQQECYLRLLEHAQELDIRIEYNLRHNLLPENMWGYVDSNLLVVGLDAHAKGDIRPMWAHNILPSTMGQD